MKRQSLIVATEMIQEMEGEVHRLLGTIEKLRSKVACDDLTGLLRRDEFFHRLEQMVALSHGLPVSLILLDIDNFKQINDQEGHLVGDHVLHRVGRVLQRCKRIGAEVGRFGGEEFLVAVCCSKERAMALAEALRRQIQREVCVTVSVGVATSEARAEVKAAVGEIRAAVGRADEALYQAKRSGKNRVCLAA